MWWGASGGQDGFGLGVLGGFQAPGIPFSPRSIWPDFSSGRWSQGGWTVGSRTLSFCLLCRDI